MFSMIEPNNNSKASQGKENNNFELNRVHVCAALSVYPCIHLSICLLVCISMIHALMHPSRKTYTT